MELLVFVCERCPAVCATSHVPTLLGAYSATCTRTGVLYETPQLRVCSLHVQ